MTPVEFKGCNVVYAKDQPEYLPLPALRTPEGDVYTCWKLTPEEAQSVYINGCIYFKQATFNQALQPILPMVELGDDIGFTK